jgi:hypothetical protein
VGIGTIVCLVVLVPHHLSAAGSTLNSFTVGYVSPDQMLPLMSALGAILGVLLIVWHRFLVMLRKSWQWCLGRLQGTVARKTST